MIIFGGCKRCSGDVQAVKEQEGTELSCIQCGYRLDYNIGMLIDIRAKLDKSLNMGPKKQEVINYGYKV